jgi:glycosyltransferase involved in cell wall biosynthesis
VCRSSPPWRIRHPDGLAATTRRLLAPEAPPDLVTGPPPSISVLIPCYNAAPTVARAVDSVLHQTTRAHEVIVCDDGSTDRSEKVLEGFGDAIVLLRKKNGGGASALNHALAAATGDFVAVLDADDFYDPERIAAIGRAAASRPDLDIVTTDAWLEQEGERIGTYAGANPFAARGQRAAILDTCFPGGWPAVRRRRLREAGGWDESYRVAYDWECWLRLILTGSSVGMVDEPLMTYHVHEGSLSADKVLSMQERLRLLRAVDPAGLSSDEREARKRALSRDSRRLRRLQLRLRGAALRGAISPGRRSRHV